jgi:hypothetical protein
VSSSRGSDSATRGGARADRQAIDGRENSLFYGHLPASAARRLVCAEFLLVDYTSSQRLDLMLAPLIAAAHRFDCASVYVLKHFS